MRKKSNLPVIITIWSVAVVLLAAIILFIIFQPEKINPKNYCPSSGKPLGLTALILDASDKLTNSQVARLENELKNISAISQGSGSSLLARGERLVVYSMREEGENPEKIFDLCHPGRYEDKTAFEKANSSSLYANRQWLQFVQTMRSEINKQVEAAAISPLPTSPIVETINFIRSKEFPPPRALEQDKKYRFVIWSDMLQNSKAENHLRSNISEVGPIFQRYPMQLSGMEVYIYNLISEKYNQHQTGNHYEWWEEFFRRSNAELKEWGRIP